MTSLRISNISVSKVTDGSFHVKWSSLCNPSSQE